MKRASIVCLLVIFLCGCSAQNSIDQALSLRQRFTDAESCQFLCTVTADYLDAIYQFSMECSFDRTGNMTFTVSSPDSIAGISGKVGEQGGSLCFDDQELAFQMMADGYISPVISPWIMVKALRGGYIHSCGKDGEGFRITIDDSFAEQPLQVDIWTDELGTPVHGEILWQGRRILTLDVSALRYM